MLRHSGDCTSPDARLSGLGLWGLGVRGLGFRGSGLGVRV